MQSATMPYQRFVNAPFRRPRAAAVAAVAGAWTAAHVDDALDDSFPASDPPSWTGFRTGPPANRRHGAGLA